MAVHQFAVYAQFGGVTLTEGDAEKLTRQRALHLDVVSCDPAKISATASAQTIDGAIRMLAEEVARVAPDAAVTNVNAIEVSVERVEAAVGVSKAS